MAKQSELFLTKQVNGTPVQFVNADGTGFKNLFTAGADDSIINQFWIASTDTSARTLFLYLYSGSGTYFPIGHIAIPANAGTDGTVARVNGLTIATLPGLLFDPQGNAYFKVRANWQLVGAMLVAVTASRTITVSALGEDF